jgi:hypothetical protein
MARNTEKGIRMMTDELRTEIKNQLERIEKGEDMKE